MGIVKLNAYQEEDKREFDKLDNKDEAMILAIQELTKAIKVLTMRLNK